MNDQLPPPGWHPAPDGSRRYRYWDGRNWTEHFAPMDATAPVAAQPPTAPTPGPAPVASQNPNVTAPSPSASPEIRAAGFGPAIDWVKAHKVWASVIGVFAFFLIVASFGAPIAENTTSQVADSTTSGDEAADEPAEPEPVEPPPTEPAIELPDAEAKFLAIVHEASNSTPADANELQVVQIKTQRGTDMCAALGPSLAVQNWVGTVEDLSTELGGDKAVFSVRLSDTVAVQTWNNGMSDVGAGTLIDPSSALFDTISKFSKGDVVTFSGNFIHGDKCLEEQSMIDISGLRTPDFSFKFNSVEAN